MKILFLILTIKLSVYCSGQFSISGGMSRLKEGVRGENEDRKLFGEQRLYNYNSYQIQFDYTRSFFRVYGQLGLIRAEFPIEVIDSYNNGGGGSSSLYWYSKNYQANLEFSYLFGKIGLGGILISKKTNKFWGSLSYNLFGQLDSHLNSKLTDQVMNSRSFSWHSPSVGYLLTINQPDYNTYQLVSFENRVFNYGMEVLGRFGFRNYFFELNASLGKRDDTRFFLMAPKVKNIYPASHWNFNAGIKLGYFFKKRNKAQNATEDKI